MLEKLSGDAVEPDQLAQLHGIRVGLSQPLRPAQRPGGAEVEWRKLESMVLEARDEMRLAAIHGTPALENREADPQIRA